MYYGGVRSFEVKCFFFCFEPPWGKSDKPICGSTASSHLIKDNTWIPLISVSGKLFTTSLTLWLLHPSGVWLWVMKVFRCAYYVVSQFSCRLLWSNKESEQSCYVEAISAWHTSEKCQRSGADKVGVNSWLTQSLLLKIYLCVPSLPCSLLLCLSIFPNLGFFSLSLSQIVLNLLAHCTVQ